MSGRCPNATATVSGTQQRAGIPNCSNPIVRAVASRPSSAFAFLLEGDEAGTGRPLARHVRQGAGGAPGCGGRAGRVVRTPGDERETAGVARLDGRSELLVQVDLLGVDVGGHVARQALQYNVQRRPCPYLSITCLSPSLSPNPRPATQGLNHPAQPSQPNVRRVQQFCSTRYSCS